MAGSARQALLHGLALGFNVRSWHGPNLMASLRGIDPATAVWRPQPGRHNINELVVHAAYWKYRLCRLLTGDDLEFELPGSDFFPRNVAPTPQAWRADVALLRQWHAALVAAADAVPERRLATPSDHAPFTIGELLHGAAAHDLYHAGQIQMLKRMYRANRG